MLTDPIAIIDIGSNSVRLVVYAGAARVPSVIFNEKVMAGLGRDMGPGRMLSEAAQDRALAALRRFRILTRQMRVGRTRVVATAAVRDAANGADFVSRVRETGFEPEVLTGEEEGLMAGQGVLSGIPQADGIVGRSWRRQPRTGRHRRRAGARQRLAAARRPAAERARLEGRRDRKEGLQGARRQRLSAARAQACLLPRRRLVASACAARHAAQRLSAPIMHAYEMAPGRAAELSRRWPRSNPN
jgi:exopolyphosphatase/guanosine-5'-triphosphate,3'-diphosphate pyrophosphatase